MSQQPGFGPPSEGQPPVPYNPADPRQPGTGPFVPGGPSWKAGAYPQNGQAPQGRDPRLSFAQPPPTPVHIESFAPPKSLISTAVTIAALVVLVAVIVVGLFLRPSPKPTPTPTPTPTRTATPRSTDPGLPFTSPDGSMEGRWLIEGSRWSGSGLSVRIRIYADNGPIDFSFQAFANRSAELVNQAPGVDRPELDSGYLEDGQQADGWVFFPTPHEDTTIVLRTGDGDPMSALVVKG